MNSKDIDVKLLGLSEGDIIQFTENGSEFEISAVTKTLMLSNKDAGERYWSIRATTRKLRNGDLPDDLDVWSLWTYKGKTLRGILERNM